MEKENAVARWKERLEMRRSLLFDFLSRESHVFLKQVSFALVGEQVGLRL